MQNAVGWIILIAGMVAVVVAIKGTQHALLPGLFGAPASEKKTSFGCQAGNVYWQIAGPCDTGYISTPTFAIGEICTCVPS